MSDEETDADAQVSPHKPRKGAGVAAGCLCLGVVFYFLSPPLYSYVMFRASLLGWDTVAGALDKSMSVIYAPLIWLAEHFEFRYVLICICIHHSYSKGTILTTQKKNILL